MKYILKGRDLINLRHKKALSQGQLASLVGFTGPTSIGRIEKGERPVDWDKLQKIANVFEVTPESLIESEVREFVISPEVLKGVRAPYKPARQDYSQESFEDILRRIEKLEKSKPTANACDEFSEEEKELVMLFRCASEPQRKAALAAARAILGEKL